MCNCALAPTHKGNQNSTWHLALTHLSSAASPHSFFQLSCIFFILGIQLPLVALCCSDIVIVTASDRCATVALLREKAKAALLLLLFWR